MIFIAAFILGMAFASAGLVAKEINSGFGKQIANRRVHEYMTWLGALSNLVLPITAVVIVSVVRGVEGGALAALGLVIGALLLGGLRMPYPFRLLLAVFGVPITIMLFLFITMFV